MEILMWCHVVHGRNKTTLTVTEQQSRVSGNNVIDSLWFIGRHIKIHALAKFIGFLRSYWCDLL